MIKASKNRIAGKRQALGVSPQAPADQITKAIKNLADQLRTAPKNRIAEVRNARGMTQQELADRVGAHWITISKLERGIIKLTTEWLEKLANPLGVHAWELLPGQLRTGLAQPEWSPDTFREESSFLFGGRWVTVQDDSHEPILHLGDQVLLRPLREVVAKDLQSLEGRLCLFEGGKVTRFGFLYSGKKLGTFDIFWLGQRVIQGAKTSEISLVSSIRFKSPY
jgi:transcriptional regulator with XRE-family HTH domain